jgi:hypothetical protein
MAAYRDQMSESMHLGTARKNRLKAELQTLALLLHGFSLERWKLRVKEPFATGPGAKWHS